MDDELGYLRDYGQFILSGILVCYGILYSFLCKDYGPIDE